MIPRLSIPRLIAAVCLLAAIPCRADAHEGLRNVTLLLIRHADKPDTGDGLSPAGEARAGAYVAYFENFQFDSKPVKIEAIFAAADSRSSQRPRRTVEPLAHALGLPVNASIRDDDHSALVNLLHARHEGKNILVCWHHGKMPDLLHELGANPDTLLPEGKWPSDTYNWVIVLRYGADGRLKDARRIEENF